MIIFRYIAKEILTATIIVTVILLAIFLGNQCVRFLMQIADGDMAYDILLHMMAVEVPFLLGYLLPIGFFFGMLLSLGRLYADSELIVMHACGISRSRLLGMCFAIALPIILIVSLLVFWVAPSMMLNQARAMSVQGAQLLFKTIVPGRFKSLPGDKQVFYVQGLSQDHKIMQGVFAANYESQKNLQEAPNWVIYTAKSAYQTQDKAKQHHFLIAKDGYRFAGQPGSLAYTRTHFGQLGVALTPGTPENRLQEKAMSSRAIWQGRHRNLDYAAEWQWRWSMPFSVIVLVFLAVPLSKVNPRKGRYAKLLPAILLYIIYANMLFVARRWVASGVVASELGLWLVHGPALALGLILLSYERLRNRLIAIFAKRLAT